MGQDASSLDEYRDHESDGADLSKSEPATRRQPPRRPYFSVSCENARHAQLLGGSCLWVYMTVVKRVKQLRRSNRWVWLDPSFIEAVGLGQQTVRRAVDQLARAGLLAAVHKQGRFIKVKLLKDEG